MREVASRLPGFAEFPRCEARPLPEWKVLGSAKQANLERRLTGERTSG
jgi:hypothetical protein